MHKKIKLDVLRTDHVVRDLDPDIIREFEQVFLHGDYRKASPLSWFIDCTYLRNNVVWKSILESYCTEKGCIPIIEYDSALGWVFHTLFTPDGLVHKKEIAKKFIPPRNEQKNERGLEGRIMEWLKSQGIEVQRQYHCPAGIVDLITSDTIFEVETTLTRAKIYHALGQVLIYRQSIKPLRKAVIIGYEASDTKALIPYVKEIGVEIVIWKDIDY